MTKGSNYNDGSIDGKFKLIDVVSAIPPLVSAISPLDSD
jgi:hypothetical protein